MYVYMFILPNFDTDVDDVDMYYEHDPPYITLEPIQSGAGTFLSTEQPPDLVANCGDPPSTHKHGVLHNSKYVKNCVPHFWVVFERPTWWLIPLSKWVITPVISGLTLLIPFITGVITHFLSGMSHQVGKPKWQKTSVIEHRRTSSEEKMEVWRATHST